jgi:hypothetical protein
MNRNKPSLYLLHVVSTMFVLPVISILLERMNHQFLPSWPLIGKWFVFWAVGVRVFVAGLRQTTRPSFTAAEIFHIPGTESFAVVRELGFGNLSIGLGGILSLLKPDWTNLMAIVGGLYLGIAGIQHLLKKPDSINERIALISDVFVFTVLLIYLLFSFE